MFTKKLMFFLSSFDHKIIVKFAYNKLWLIVNKIEITKIMFDIIDKITRHIYYENNNY